SAGATGTVPRAAAGTVARYGPAHVGSASRTRHRRGPFLAVTRTIESRGGGLVWRWRTTGRGRSAEPRRIEAAFGDFDTRTRPRGSACGVWRCRGTEPLDRCRRDHASRRAGAKRLAFPVGGIEERARLSGAGGN